MAEPRRSTGKEAGDLKGARILLVEARFYEDIADALLKGATRALEEAGAAVERVSVPGSLEVAPAIAIALDAAERAGKPYDGAVALGCVIRGETLHFEIVSQESAR
ncbi:MAG: 6,7-dimethyl-8-ribityllumazine synthase, partial [Xanthobacteraceae bacterium]